MLTMRTAPLFRRLVATDIAISDPSVEERDAVTAPDQRQIVASYTPARWTGRRRWTVVAAAAVILVGVSLAIPAGRHQWALSLIRQPTPYTALSFEDPYRLPTTLPAGAHLNLAFAVTNREGRDLRYRYVVTSASSGQVPVVLRSGVLVVPVGVKKTESVSVVPACKSSPCRVQVSLPASGETINVQVNLRVQPS